MRGNPLPTSSNTWTKPDGIPTDVFLQYMNKLDQLVTALQVSGVLNAGTGFIGLLEAADNAAAAAAGVPLGGLYKTTTGASVAVKVRTV